MPADPTAAEHKREGTQTAAQDHDESRRRRTLGVARPKPTLKAKALPVTRFYAKSIAAESNRTLSPSGSPFVGIRNRRVCHYRQ